VDFWENSNILRNHWDLLVKLQVYSSTEHLSTSTPSNQSLSSSERSHSEEKEERWEGRGVLSPGDGHKHLASGDRKADGPRGRWEHEKWEWYPYYERKIITLGPHSRLDFLKYVRLKCQIVSWSTLYSEWVFFRLTLFCICSHGEMVNTVPSTRFHPFYMETLTSSAWHAMHSVHTGEKSPNDPK